MTLKDRVLALTNAIGAKIKDLYSNQGSLSALNTTSKTSLVSAINEVKSSINSSSASINDTLESSSSTYSSTKIQSQIDASKSALKNEIFGGSVSTALDTLAEIEAKFGSTDTATTNLLASVGNRIRYDASQTLTSVQITQACNNIGVGEPDFDFVTAFNNSLV